MKHTPLHKKPNELKVIDRSYALEQLVEAYQYVGVGYKRGDVIIPGEQNYV